MRRNMIVFGVVAMALSMGARNANAVRIVTANEGPGDPNNIITLTDSVFGLVCSANEDTAACNYPATISTPIVTYQVNSSFISPAFQGGGSAGINFRDELAITTTMPPCGVPTNGNLCSDELYLTVSAPSPASGLYTLTWCWDSDLEPNVVICPAVAGTTTNLLEPAFGFVDVTPFFTGSAGPLASGQWQILAQSDTPEPASLFLAGIGLVVGALCLRKRRVFRMNNFAGGTPVISLRQ